MRLVDDQLVISNQACLYLYIKMDHRSHIPLPARSSSSSSSSSRFTSNRGIRTNSSSIYNRGNPFSTIKEESGEESQRSNATPDRKDATFTFSESSLFKSRLAKRLEKRPRFFVTTSDQSMNSSKNGIEKSTLPFRRHFNFQDLKESFSSQEQSFGASSAVTSSSSGIDPGKKDSSISFSPHKTTTDMDTNTDLSGINLLSIDDHKLNTTSLESEKTLMNKKQTHNNDKSVKLMSNLLVEANGKMCEDRSLINLEDFDKEQGYPHELHSVMNAGDLRVNINVRVRYTKLNNLENKSLQPRFMFNKENDQFTPTITSTPSKEGETLVFQALTPALPPKDVFDSHRKLSFMSNMSDSAASSCSSLASTDLNRPIRRKCKSFDDLDLDSSHRLSAITVVVRVRPMTRKESQEGRVCNLLQIYHQQNQIGLMDRSDQTKLKYLFKFDHCFGYPLANLNTNEQKEIFDQIGQTFIENVFRGYNLCYFAYGQTGTGKSYTIMGDDQNPGLITRFARQIFELISTYKDKLATVKVQNSGLVRNLTFTKDSQNQNEHQQTKNEAVQTDFGNHFLYNALPVYSESKFELNSNEFNKNQMPEDSWNGGPSASYQKDGDLFNKQFFADIFHLNDPTSEIKFTLEISFYEIYNERIYDLLDETQQKNTSKVREHPISGPYIVGLTTKQVESIDQLLYYYNLGIKKRSTSTSCENDQSSRSHAIFAMNVSQERTFRSKMDMLTNFSGPKNIEKISSKVNFVDLAGSERASSTTRTGERLKEGNLINKSLLTLGKVIQNLSKKSRMSNCNKKCPHYNPRLALSDQGLTCRSCSTDFLNFTGLSGYVPYRDSILTWLLKDCLGGNSKTVMIATVSPSEQHYEQTLCTLRYAQKAAYILNNVRVNHSYLSATSKHLHLIHPEAFVSHESLDEIDSIFANEQTLANVSLPTTTLTKVSDTIGVYKSDFIDKVLDLFVEILNETF